jgi:hypothetical protein
MSQETMIPQFKELLESNTKLLSVQIEMNKEILAIKMAELKEDTEDIKKHVAETNGKVKQNRESILVIEEKQYQESKRRRRTWAVSLAAITTMFGVMITYIVHKFSS